MTGKFTFRKGRPAWSILGRLFTLKMPLSNVGRLSLRTTLFNTAKTHLNRSLATHAIGAGSRAGSHRVVVVGGGAAGQAASHQLLRTGVLKNAADILLIDLSKTHDYQPGWTLVGGGLKSKEELRRPMKELIGADERLAYLEDAVVSFEPENNRLKTADGRSISYEHLVVCPGLGINWSNIKGLEDRLKEGRNVTSIYSYDTCSNVYPRIDALKSGKALFTQPAGVIKCAGAPQKIMWLGLDHWKKQGLYKPEQPDSSKIQITFATGMPTMFSAPKYNAALEELRKQRGVSGLFNHNLTSIDGNVATFSVPPTGDSQSASIVQREFDFLHVSPPMGPLPFIKNSPLADKATGFVEVDERTTRHKHYSNVWSIGDSSSLPTSKTAAAITSETPVLVGNLSAALEGRQPEEIYDGYTSCPLLTEYGKVMLAEFKYGGVPKESFSFLGIDQAVPQRAFYHLKRDFFPWVYYNSHVKGTWQGPKGWSLGGQIRSYTKPSIYSTQRRGFATSPFSGRNLPARRSRDPLDLAPNATRHALPSGETLIIRPSPSAPSPRVGMSETVTDPGSLPTLRSRRQVRNLGNVKVLSESDIEKIQSLRKSDPTRHSAMSLAREFQCSPTYIRIVAPLDRNSRVAKQLPQLQKEYEWGANKRMHRELRKERRSLW